MLLTKNEWIEFSQNSKIKVSEGYLLVYQIDLSNRLLKMAKRIAKDKGLKIVTIPFPLGGWISSTTNISAGPREWVKLFSLASYVVTDSFHGCCMSLIMNVDFNVVITGAGTRIVSLLDNMNLPQRLIRDYSANTNNICWSDVNKKISEERKYSLMKLKDTLK